MKTNRPVLVFLAAALAAGALTSCSGGQDVTPAPAEVVATADVTDAVVASSSDVTAGVGYEEDHPEVAALPSQDLTEAEVEALLFMREEEKLARDVYVALGEIWGLQVFDNISQSETSHMDAVLELLDRYGLEDPAREPGVFTNPDLQALYDELMALGSQSLADALIVGATIEDVDIVDLQVRIAETDNEDIQLVFGNLLKGSENHLRAFTRQLERNGVDYQPQYLTQEEYEGIVATSSGNGNA